MKKVLIGIVLGAFGTIVTIMIFLGLVTKNDQTNQAIGAQYWGW